MNAESAGAVRSARSGPRPHNAGAARQRYRFGAFINTLDELDILPMAIEHLRAIGVETIFVSDFGSTDGSLDYLAGAETVGDIWLLHPRPEDRVATVNAARIALAREAGLDWVLFLDTDEFWLPVSGSLHDLDALADYDAVQVARYNVVLGSDGPMMPLGPSRPPLAETFVHAMPIPSMGRYMLEHPDAAWIEGDQMPSVMARPAMISAIAHGDHDVTPAADRTLRQAYASDMLVAHVPFRTLQHFERKVAHVSAVVEAKRDKFTGTNAWHWVRWAAQHQDGTITDEFERQRTTPAEFEARTSSAFIRSAESILQVVVPTFESEDHYARAVERSQPWLAAAAIALRRHGLAAGSNLAKAPRGRYPTVLKGSGHVIRLYGPWKGGHRAKQNEVSALRLLERDPALQVPHVLGDGQFDDAWGYVIESRVAGVALADVIDDLNGPSLADVATWLGRFVKRLHAIELSPEERARAGEPFWQRIETRYANLAPDLTAAAALPPHLLEQLDHWLPPLADLIVSDADLVPLHGDLGRHHLLGGSADGKLHVQGVIDFSRSRIGAPLYELGPVWCSLFQGDATLLRSFLSAAAYRDLDDDAFPRRALTWCLLHEEVAGHIAEVPGVATAVSLDELAVTIFAAAP